MQKIIIKPVPQSHTIELNDHDYTFSGVYCAFKYNSVVILVKDNVNTDYKWVSVCVDTGIYNYEELFYTKKKAVAYMLKNNWKVYFCQNITEFIQAVAKFKKAEIDV